MVEEEEPEEQPESGEEGEGKKRRLALPTLNPGAVVLVLALASAAYAVYRVEQVDRDVRDLQGSGGPGGSPVLAASSGFIEIDARHVTAPVRNVGGGIAIIQGTPALLRNCTSATKSVKADIEASSLGTYAIPAGETQRVAWNAQTRKDRRALSRATRSTRLHVLLSYSGLDGRSPHYTCLDLRRSGRTAPWSIGATSYGNAAEG